MKDILDGSKLLLSESLELIGDSINDIIIVGGWGPYLRHQDVHPGTKDVDILFPLSHTRESILEILEKFLENGFYISAKNDFQLCRSYKLGKRTYIYNVDLLHPTEGKVNKVDFIEIMNLDVKVGIKVKSINTVSIQYGDVIASENLYEKITFDGKTFNVLDGAGIIISKINSCQNKKRPRDIYDIYLSLFEKNMLEKLQYLKSINEQLSMNFNTYRKSLKSDWETYQKHLMEFGIEDKDAQKVLLMRK